MRRFIYVLLFVNFMFAGEFEQEQLLDVVTKISDVRNLIVSFLDKWDIIKKIDCDSEILCLAGSPNGEYIAYATFDKKIILCKSDLSEILKIFSDQKVAVTAICFLNNNNIVSGYKNGIVKIFDINGGLSVQQLNQSSPRSNFTRLCCIRQLTQQGKEVENFERDVKLHTDEITKIALSNDEEFLTTSSFDKTLKSYNLKDRSQKTFIGHRERVFTFAFSPDGKNIASGGDEKTIRIWDFNNGNCLKILSSHMAAVLSISFINNNELISGSDDNSIRHWWWDTSKDQSVVYAGHKAAAVTGLSFLRHTNNFIYCSDGTVGIWDIETKNLEQYDCKSNSIRNLITSGGNVIAFTSQNSIILLCLPLQYISII